MNSKTERCVTCHGERIAGGVSTNRLLAEGRRAFAPSVRAGAVMSGQRAKVDASICLIPGRLSLDCLEFRATMDLE